MLSYGICLSFTYFIQYESLVPSTEKKIVDMENRLVVVKREGGRSWMDWEFGVNGCKLLPLE